MAEPDRPLWDWFASWGADPISWDDVWPDEWPWSRREERQADWARENLGHNRGQFQPGWTYDRTAAGTGGDTGAARTYRSTGDDHREPRSAGPAYVGGGRRRVDPEHGGRRADAGPQPDTAESIIEDQVSTLADALSAVDTAIKRTTGEIREARLRKKMGLPAESKTATVVTDRNGNRHVIQGGNSHLYNTLNDKEARRFLEKAKANGELPVLREQLFYAGAYGDATVNYGDEVGYTDDDIAAVKDFMDYANNAGGSVHELLPQQARQGRRLGGPLGTDVEFEDQPINQLNEYIDANGLEVSNDWVRRQMRMVGSGKITVDDSLKELRKMVIAEYPAWEDQIKAGSTVSDLAAPYQKAVAKTLEIPLADVKVTDPLVQKGLQSVGSDGKPGIKPLWQFNQDLRKDPRWQYTDSAWSEVGGTAEEVMRMFGMTP